MLRNALIVVLMLTSGIRLVANNVPGSKASIVSGTIVDSASGETLSGVKVHIPGTDLVTFSDKEGNFSFTQIPSGEFKVVFQLVSFETAQLVFQEQQVPTAPIEISMSER